MKHNENTREFLNRLKNTADALNEPYGLDFDALAEATREIEDWLKDGQNDCLRARGDWRWQRACEIHGSLLALAEPF